MDREIPLSIQRKEKRKLILQYGIIALAIIIVIIFLMNILESTLSYKSITIGTVDKGTIEVTVNASGKVIPLTEEIIVSPINSRILEVYKNAGDSVLSGEPILKLELASVETDYNQKLDEKEMKASKLIQSKITLENRISELQMQMQVKD
ncbi:MAG: efflux RND transporter periplasmic adaptor subunit, partial [Prevotella sp.]|nr:efflux RND transporter periplasmic adaptor subunit [Prevotella sp.]